MLQIVGHQMMRREVQTLIRAQTVNAFDCKSDAHAIAHPGKVTIIQINVIIPDVKIDFLALHA
eukprot:1145482-Pelagomonas_calceolata.AAC.3